MRIKALLAVIIVVGLLALISTQKTFFEAFKRLTGKIVSGIFDLFGEKGETYGLILRANKETFFESTFEIVNSSVSVKGKCSEFKINEVNLEPFDCEISLENSNGKIKYLKNEIQGELSAQAVKINEISTKQAKIKFTVSPSEFFISKISNDEILVNVTVGTLEILNVDGSTRCLINFRNETVKIKNYVGTLELERDFIILRGVADFVKPCV